MITRFRLIWLTVRNAWLLMIMPILSAYVILPLVYITCFYWCTQEELLNNTIFTIEAIMPISGLLWILAYLQMWIDSDGEETMRACYRGKHTSSADLIILTIIYLIALIPVFFLFRVAGTDLWQEYFRAVVQTFLYGSILYLAAVGLHSTAMGSMLLLAYHLFCISFSRQEKIRAFCLIQPNIHAEDASLPYFVILVASAFLYFVGTIIERSIYKKWIC